MNPKSKWVLGPLALSLLSLSAACAAEGLFDLFDSSRGQEKTEPAPPPLPAPKPVLPTPPKPRLIQKDFVLRGTTLLGQSHSVVLETPEGKQIVQKMSGNGPIEISGYPGYQLVKVQARSAQLHYPDSGPCQEDRKDKGVKCKSESLVELSLVRANPTAPRVAPPPVPTLPPQSLGSAPTGLPMPGAAQAPGAGAMQPLPQGLNAPVAEVGQDRQPRQPGFRPQVIRDEDVPPGMKVIRTPFGDRLVPVR